MSVSAPVKQQEFEGVEFDKIKDSPLGRATRTYLELKQGLEAANLKLETVRKDVIDQIHAIGKTSIKIAIDGERHVFSVVESKEKLSVKKESKTPKGKEHEMED